MKKFIMFIMVVLIFVAIGLGGWYIYDSQQKSSDEIATLKNEINTLKESSKRDNNENNNTINNSNTNNQDDKSTGVVTISSLIGGYDNGGSETEYQSLYLYENGTFAYYTSGVIDSHYEGYYIINNNKIKFYSILDCANDPSAVISNKTFDGTVNNGAISIDKVVMKKSEATKSVYNTYSENGGIDLSGSISGRFKNNFLFVNE